MLLSKNAELSEPFDEVIQISIQGMMSSSTLLFPRPSKLGRLQIEGGARAGREGRRGVFFSRRPQLSSCYANDEHNSTRVSL